MSNNNSLRHAIVKHCTEAKSVLHFTFSRKGEIKHVTFDFNRAYDLNEFLGNPDKYPMTREKLLEFMDKKVTRVTKKNGKEVYVYHIGAENEF